MHCVRELRYAPPYYLLACTLALLIVLNACGGSTSNSSNSNSTATGSGSGSTGSGSSGTPGPASTRYLYVGIGSDLGGVDGFKVDSTTGAMTQVPGAPLLFGTTANAFSQAGPVAAAKGFVYVGFGPPNFAAPTIRSYAVDPSTGSLGNYTEIGAGAQNGDNQMRLLVTDASGQNLYAMFQHNISSFQINSDGSLTFLSTATNLAIGFLSTLSVSPTGQLAFVMADNCPPKGIVCMAPDFLLLNRDSNTGALSNSGRLMQQNNVSDVSGDISTAFDNTGKYFVGWTINNTSTSSTSQITVYSVDYTHQTLTPVNTYPTTSVASVGTLSPLAFAFDASNSFLYVLESSIENQQPEALVAFSFTQTSGALSQLQVQTLPSGTFATGLVLDDSFAYVIDTGAGSAASTIYVLRHGSNGTLTGPVFTQMEAGMALGSGAELRF